MIIPILYFCFLVNAGMARTKDFDEIAVLQKAVELFWCKGYNGASAQDLVDHLGISRSSLYDTFGDKKTLFIRALEHYRKEMSGAMVDMINQSTDIEQTITQIFERAVNDSIHDSLSKGCFMVNCTIELAPHDKDIFKIVEDNKKAVEEALFFALEKGQANGQITNKQTARSLARFIYNNFAGLHVVAKSETDKKVLDDIVKVTLFALKP